MRSGFSAPVWPQLQLHQTLGGKADHLAQQIGVGHYAGGGARSLPSCQAQKLTVHPPIAGIKKQCSWRFMLALLIGSLAVIALVAARFVRVSRDRVCGGEGSITNDSEKSVRRVRSWPPSIPHPIDQLGLERQQADEDSLHVVLGTNSGNLYWLQLPVIWTYKSKPSAKVIG
jgi:hypothetical protein